MPLTFSNNCRILECVIWNATRLYNSPLSMLVWSIFVDILECKVECTFFSLLYCERLYVLQLYLSLWFNEEYQSFVKKILEFYCVKCGMPSI
jgi:hypothetical protein